VWLIGAMVCLLAASWVLLSTSAGNGWPHNALRHHWLMPISCHFRDCKALLVTSLTHVSGAIASVQTFTFVACCPHPAPLPSFAFLHFCYVFTNMHLTTAQCSLLTKVHRTREHIQCQIPSTAGRALGMWMWRKLGLIASLT